MSQPQHTRPSLPSQDEIAKLPPDGGPNYNRLVFEKSPYLLQHAANPVDWYPWGEEAFAKARRDNKPVFLSVGYSTCHWCHVMEHESFEDEEVAALLNQYMVPIKVDREERPDIDQVYMTVTQAMTGQGGWPMTVVMTPDKKPFFAGTYFPKGGGMGRPGMTELIPALGKAWKTEHADILKSADHITEVISGLAVGAPGDMPSTQTLEQAFRMFSDNFDSVHGGFRERPKFPVPHNLLFLMRYYANTKDDHALQMVETTLQKMRLGGIFDHVGFGFHRYSTDEVWLLPHFEKMLYDQALLTMAYTEAYQLTHKKEYGQTAREIISYVLRDMTSPEGAFYSAEDADSEGVEGKFYVWTPGEVESVVGKADALFFNKVYNIENGGNFREEATQARTGENIPHLRKSLNELASEMGTEPEEFQQRLELIRIKLFEAREKRVHPYKDDKVLADWNGLMIAALAKASKALDSPEYAEAAARAADFVLADMRHDNGSLMKRYRAGEAGLPVTLEDYAFFTFGLIELYEATFEVKYLREALALTEIMIARYWDEDKGGFFMTADDAEKLLVRSKDAYDGAIPSGNAVAVWNLARLARFTGRTSLTEKGADTVKAFAAGIDKIPIGHSVMLIGLDFLLASPWEIVLAGEREDESLRKMVEETHRHYLPHAILLHRPPGDAPSISEIAEYTRSQPPVEGDATGYVCRDYACQLPATTFEEFERLLQGAFETAGTK